MSDSPGIANAKTASLRKFQDCAWHFRYMIGFVAAYYLFMALLGLTVGETYLHKSVNELCDRYASDEGPARRSVAFYQLVNKIDEDRLSGTAHSYEEVMRMLGPADEHLNFGDGQPERNVYFIRNLPGRDVRIAVKRSREGNAIIGYLSD